MDQQLRRRLFATIPVDTGINALAELTATLAAAGTGFTRLGSGCVVMPAQGGEMYFTPSETALDVELRHPENAARLQPYAQDVLAAVLPQAGQLRWS